MTDKNLERDLRDSRRLRGFLLLGGSWLFPRSRAALHNEGSSSSSEIYVRRDGCKSRLLL